MYAPIRNANTSNSDTRERVQSRSGLADFPGYVADSFATHHPVNICTAAWHFDARARTLARSTPKLIFRFPLQRHSIEEYLLIQISEIDSTVFSIRKVC